MVTVPVGTLKIRLQYGAQLSLVYLDQIVVDSLEPGDQVIRVQRDTKGSTGYPVALGTQQNLGYSLSQGPPQSCGWPLAFGTYQWCTG